MNLASPLIAGGRAYLFPSGSSTTLHAVDLATGSAVAGWPIDIPAPLGGTTAPSGTVLDRRYVVSSLAGTGTRVVFNWRVDENLDTNADRLVDTYVVREQVVSVDPVAARVQWTAPNGALVTSDRNRVSAQGFAPTPALYLTTANEALMAVTSTVWPRLRVLDALTGVERWATTLSGATRSSPVLANGRLVVATDAGSIHSFLSLVNQPPSPPVPVHPAAGSVIQARTGALRWSEAADPERRAPRYVVRLDDDGEVLRDWDIEAITEPGQLSLSLAGRLTPDRSYTYAVRARDAQGALSSWSPAQTFQTTPADWPRKDLRGLSRATSSSVLGSSGYQPR